MQSTTVLRQAPSSAVLTWADTPSDNRNILFRLFHSLLRLLLITFSEYKKNDLALRSSALTYTVLLSLVPVLAMSTAVMKGLGYGDELKEVAYTYIDTLDNNYVSTPFLHPDEAVQTPAEAPPEGPNPVNSSSITSHLRSAIDQLFDYVDKTNFATLGTIGVVGIFFSVILVLSNIEMAMNTIWHVKDSRSISRKVADYLALMVLLPPSIIIAFAASAFLKTPTLAEKFQLLIPFAWMQALILQLVPVFFIALSFYVMYIFFPNTKVKTTPAVIGSILAAMLWFGVQNVYISLQVGVSNYNAIYGSFATLPIFLIWMYLGLLFILGGAQFAFACQNITTYRLTPVHTAPSTRLSAAFDIMTTVQNAFNTNQAINDADIFARYVNYDAQMLQSVIDDLIVAEVLHVSAQNGRLLPAAPAGQIGHELIIEIILGNEIPDTAGGKTSQLALQAAAQSRPGSDRGGSGILPGSLQEEESST
ncbi:YihY/virulence factor BrkB family protein [Desulfosediminicola flagellatus]|uniref:YihY/virulence factor BrkB family protein n=1 Tax=Desulfosediminicola flagellatus TaxID=2569541 RepID=UPI0010AD9451|nr:YihY/virulence factor BrkB family protein [Desulfosediminicola flagellatus]